MTCEDERAQVEALRNEITDIQDEIRTASPQERPTLIRLLTATRQELADAAQRLQDCTARPAANLTIVEIERTQAIQFFKWHTQGSGFAPDNTVPLIDGRTLILRAYVAQTHFPELPTPSAITGTVTVAGTPAITPLNGPITPRSELAIDRNIADHTLNFSIPPSICHGLVNFTVVAFDPAHPGDPAYTSSPREFSAAFDIVPSVPVHGVLIHYTGVGLDIHPPTSAEVVDTLRFALQTYPISNFDFTGFTAHDFNGDLTRSEGGGCGLGWSQLFSLVANLRNASGTRDVYVGLLPLGVPTSFVLGCGGGGVALGFTGRGATMAQEIGHTFGRAHAPCGSPPNPDPNYPAYDSYPSGSIGEFGFDMSTSQVSDPASTFDFMSYCGPSWVSPYTYVGLKDNIAQAVAAADPARPEVRDVTGEFLFLNFRLHRDGHVQLLPSFHLHSPAPLVEGATTPVWFQFIDADGRVLDTHYCRLSDPHQDAQSPELVLHAAVPWQPATTAILFGRFSEVCHRHELSDAPPEIGTINVLRLGELARVEWQPAENGPPLTYLVRYRQSLTAAWRAVAANLSETYYEVSLDLLPGGEECQFQVVATSGIRTTVAESEPFPVDIKPARPYILEPQASTAYRGADGVALLGWGFSPDFGTTRPQEVVWSSSRDGHLGSGHQLVVKLTPGRHRITVAVPDGMGQEATADVSIIVGPTLPDQEQHASGAPRPADFN